MRDLIKDDHKAKENKTFNNLSPSDGLESDLVGPQSGNDVVDERQQDQDGDVKTAVSKYGESYPENCQNPIPCFLQH